MFHFTLISRFAEYLLFLSHLHHFLFLFFSFSSSCHISLPLLTSMKDIEPQVVSKKKAQVNYIPLWWYQLYLSSLLTQSKNLCVEWRHKVIDVGDQIRKLVFLVLYHISAAPQ